MEIFTFESLLADLKGTDEWLEQNGIKERSTRVHWAIGVLEEAAKGWETFRSTGQPTKVGREPGYAFGLVEALEFHDILLAFRDEPRCVIKPKLSRVVAGPRRPSEETKTTSEPRNTQFELALAAEWKKAGLRLQIGEPDITLQIQDVCFFAECKRPFAEHSVRSNLFGAAKQLRQRLDSPGHEAARGLIAISVSRLLNPGTKVFKAQTRRGVDRLGDEVETLMRRHTNVWARGISHSQTIGVLFHVATIAEIEDRLERVAFSVVAPVGAGGREFELLKTTLQGVYPI